MNTRISHLPRFATPLAVLCLAGAAYGQATSSKSSSSKSPSSSTTGK